MTQGQYGIGLLGFWCLGESLEMRSSIPGQKPHRLILYRDRPEYRVEPLRLRTTSRSRCADNASRERWNCWSRAASPAGGARKRILVQPRRFLGERIEGLDTVHVSDHAPIRIEIYYTGDTGQNGDGEGIGVYAAGTLVAASFRDLQRAFRDFYRQRPSYAMLPVGQEGDVGAGPSGPGPGPGAAGTGPGGPGEIAAATAGAAPPDADSLAGENEGLDDGGV